MSSGSSRLELKPLSWTEGIAVGSTLIDFKARRLLIDRLGPIENEIPGDLETVIARLVDEDFTTFKCSFGVEGMVSCSISLVVPAVAYQHNIRIYPDCIFRYQACH
jgi:hypothetical protein